MIAGALLIAIGAVLAVPQVFTMTTSIGVFWLGILAALAGAMLICERTAR